MYCIVLAYVVTAAFALALPSVQLRSSASLSFQLLPNLLLANALHSSIPDLSHYNYTHLVSNSHSVTVYILPLPIVFVGNYK
jgi:hypothetical protein